MISNNYYSQKDLKILVSIYLNILSEKQCKSIFKMIDLAKKTFIEGTMPFGEHLYYCNESLLEPYLISDLRNLDGDKALLYYKIVYVLSRYLMKKRGHES